MRILGTSKVCITPKMPVRLCGFGFRKGVYDRVRKDIFVRVFDLREGTARIILIYGDLLWWNPGFVERMRRTLLAKLQIPEDQLLFAASHNHSGPGTGDCFVPRLETADEAYLAELEEKVLQAVKMAGENLEEVEMTRSEGSCALNVFRRVKTEQGVAMKPNYQVEPDRTLTVFSCYRKDGSLKGRLVHYPCHANLSKDNELHPDFPGYMLERLDREMPGSLHIFLQGCTADMRPNCVLGDQFRAGSETDVETFAGYVCEAVKEAVKQESPVEPGMKGGRRLLRLPLVQDFIKVDLEAYLEDSREEMRQWAEKILEKNMRNYETLEISFLDLGNQKFCFLNAEVSMHYAKALRERFPGAVCAGYTNGMIGYLSPASQIQEGGYEPCDSAIYFAMAGTYGESIQELIESALAEG